MLLARRVAVGGIAAVVTALAIGIPTGIIQTSWYHRMTPVLWWNYPVWAISAILTGALVATYVRDLSTPGAGNPERQDIPGKHALAIRCRLPDLQQVGRIGDRGHRGTQLVRSDPARTCRRVAWTVGLRPVGTAAHGHRLQAPGSGGMRGAPGPDPETCRPIATSQRRHRSVDFCMA